jgi:hypothetical protein
MNFHENFVVATWKVEKLISKIKQNFDIWCSHGDFSKFQKIDFKDCPHTAWLFFSFFHPTNIQILSAHSCTMTFDVSFNSFRYPLNTLLM